jgi:(hydroxyamino)benzene mutase
MSFTTAQRTLIAAGAVLFLFGLLQGALVQSFANPRMALSAHLTAVQSGMALMIAGVAWQATNLGQRVAAAGKWTIIVGMFGLWIGLTLSAATGASSSLPIAGAGYSADRLTETLVSIIVLGSSASMALGWGLFVAGLVRAMR